MSQHVLPHRTVRVEHLRPGDVVACGEGELVSITRNGCTVANLVPGSSFRVSDGSVFESFDIRLGSASEQRHARVSQASQDAARLLQSVRAADVLGFPTPDELLTPDVVGIASGMLAMIREQAAVLADALEEAGASPKSPAVIFLRSDRQSYFLVVGTARRIVERSES